MNKDSNNNNSKSSDTSKPHSGGGGKRDYQSSGGDRSRSFNRDSKPPYSGGDGGKRDYQSSGDQPRRSFNRDSKPPYSGGGGKRDYQSSGDQPRRSFNRDSKPPYSGGGGKRDYQSSGDQPRRSFNRDSKPPYSGGGGKRDYQSSGDQPRRSFNRDSKPPYSGGGGKRDYQSSGDQPRSFNRDSKPPYSGGDGGKRDYQSSGGDRSRSFNRDSKPPYSGGGGKRDYQSSGDQPRRSFNRDSKPPYSGGGGKRDYQSSGGDRSRSFNRDSKPPYSGGGGGKRDYQSSGGDRSRSFNRDSKPPYSGGDGGKRDNQSSGGDRSRSFNRDSKPPYSGGGGKRDYQSSGGDRSRSFNRDSKPPYSGGDGGKRDYQSSGGDRSRSFNRDSKPPYSGGGGKRDYQSSGDQPRRSFNRDSKPPYSGGGGKRDYQSSGDQPRRSFNRDSKPPYSGGDGGKRDNQSSGGDRSRSFNRDSKPPYSGGDGGKRDYQSSDKPSTLIRLEDIIALLESGPKSQEQIKSYLQISHSNEPILEQALTFLAKIGLIKDFSSAKYMQINLSLLPTTLIPKVAMLSVNEADQLNEFTGSFTPNILKKLSISTNEYKIIIKSSSALKPGDHIIASLKKIKKDVFLARILKYMPSVATDKQNFLPPPSVDNKNKVTKSRTPDSFIGSVKKDGDKIYVLPISRKYKDQFLLDADKKNPFSSLPDDTLLKVEIVSDWPKKVAKLKEVIILTDLHNKMSELTAHDFNLSLQFNSDVVKEASKYIESPPTITAEDRVNLTHLPFVTIDGEDAKDFDDAICITQLSDEAFKCIVAIADVSYYVSTGSQIDKEALLRANSVYLPKLVIPMLPEILSNDLCSLKPGVDRATLACEMIIDFKTGKVSSYKFYRALINSKARLTYTKFDQLLNTITDVTSDTDSNNETAQTNNTKVIDSTIEDPSVYHIDQEELMNTVLKPIYSCWQRAKLNDSSLNIKKKDYKITYSSNDIVQSIQIKPYLVSEKIIETFMILTNVASADFLNSSDLNKDKLLVENENDTSRDTSSSESESSSSTIYRVHASPNQQKIMNLQNNLNALDIKAKIPDDLSPSFFNELISEYENSDLSEFVNFLTLTSQSQAHYSNQNIGHFGLNLTDYCHFTSPIRRYADLVIHRLIINKLNNTSLPVTSKQNIASVAEHISLTERNASTAEYGALDRVMASFMKSKIGETFEATINSLTNAGLFITVESVGADGLIPMRTLGSERFFFTSDNSRLVGRNTNTSYKAGQKISAILTEANLLKGLLTFNIVASEPQPYKKRFNSDKNSRRDYKR